MRVLFTGASSFTGYWFVNQLAQAGHDVVATFTRPTPDDYSQGVRSQRVHLVMQRCTPVFGCRFGDDNFIDLIQKRKFDLFCHHAADVTNYKSADFDVHAAVLNNTYRLREVLAALLATGCSGVVIAGSVFEGGEGAGSEGLPHISPYGLSKSMTSEMFRFYCRQIGLRLGKFVLGNPFGPYEEPRFTRYLVRTWFDNQTAVVKTPAYVRDNIHISLVAKTYLSFVESLPEVPGFQQLNPSGYVESQGAFAHRFAREMRPRLGLDCRLETVEQSVFTEPRFRVNTDAADVNAESWIEQLAWDELAAYYQREFQAKHIS